MLRILSSLPIFRRLFLGFFLAALIPDIAIIVLSNNHIATLKAHGIEDAVANSLWLGTIFAVIISTALVILIGFLINVTIMRPLRQLVALTRRIARGETDQRAVISGRDEITLVAASMNSMLDNIVRLIQETRSQRDFLQSQVEELINEVGGIGEGDLRVQARATPGALGILAESFNYMIVELSSLVVGVKMLAHEVEHSTVSTDERMTELVERAGEQLRQIASAMREMRQMVMFSERVAERAQVLDNVSLDARNAATMGRSIVHETIDGMGRINENVLVTASKVQHLGERSREINEIVELIANIAHQTNRLALDAAVQAAMAGENGKGFRIVAGDIRRLSERTKEQTSIIARIVQGFREDIADVASSMHDTERATVERVGQVQETGGALETIFGLVERQAGDIAAINAMAHSLLQSLSHMTQIMQQVSSSTEKTSASTRIVAQNMEHISALAAQLQTSVEMFKLNEQPIPAKQLAAG